MALQTKNPATEEIVAVFEELSPEALEAKLALAANAFQAWKKTAFAERALLMKKLGAYIREHNEDLAKLQTLEMGKTIVSSRQSGLKCADLCDFYAEHAEKFLSPETIKTEASEQYATFDPLGVVLAVMPWNFPFWQVLRFAVPAVMAGNVGVLKHASNVPQCAQAIEDAFRAAGFPEGVFQNLAVSASRVEAVIRDPRIAAVTLTGSEKAGSEVARIAGEEIKKTVLELGGSDPFIVFADADIDRAAEVAVAARMQGNVGQSCIAAKRFIVEAGIEDVFAEKVAARMSALKVGDPSLEDTDVGPLSTEQGLRDISRQVDESVAKGAKVLTGGNRVGDKGYFYAPTVLANVRKGMPAYDEETFGPVLALISFETEEEAVRIANDTRYGLGASICTSDMARAKRLIPQIDAGNVFINQAVRSDVRAPFGGVKKSGYGRELGVYGIREFVNIKNVLIQ